MHQNGRLTERLLLHVNEIRYYNSYAKREMNARNNVALKVISGSSAALVVAFMILAYITKRWEVSPPFWLMLALFVLTYAYARLFEDSREITFLRSQIASASFHITLGALLVWLGIIYDPEQPASIFSIYLIALPIFFTTYTWLVTVVITVTGVAFCLLSEMLKQNDAAFYDIFVTVLSVVISYVVLHYFSRLRAKSFIARQKYIRLSRTDLLTGVLNKCSFEQWCHKLLDECEGGEPCALAIFDLDNFKQINDTYGHIAGDKALEIVGQTLSAFFRMDGLTGRIGGDEFAAFVCTETACESFSRKAQDAVTSVKNRAERELNLEITMSLGIAFRTGGLADYIDLYHEADRNMYKTKHTQTRENVVAL